MYILINIYIYINYINIYYYICYAYFLQKVFVFGFLVAAAFAQSSDAPVVEILTEKTYVNEDGYNFV